MRADDYMRVVDETMNDVDDNELSGYEFEWKAYKENRRDEEENIIISREINIAGKNICKINGRLVTVLELKEFMNKIIDIHRTK